MNARTITVSLVFAFLALTVCSAQEPKVSGGKAAPKQLKDLPLVQYFFNKPQADVVVDPASVGTARRIPAQGSPVRAEKRIGSVRSIPVSAVGKTTMGFGERKLRERILALPGIDGVLVLDRVDLVVSPKRRPNLAPSAGPSGPRMVDTQRFFRIDAADRDSLRLAEALIRDHFATDRQQVLIDIQIVSAKSIPYQDEFTVLKGDRATEDALSKETTASVDVAVVSAPSVLTLEGQDAEISLLEETAYVRDYEVQVVRDAAIADPVVDTIRHGLRLECAAVRDPANGRWQIAFGLQQSRLETPIRELETDVKIGGRRAPVTIQLPEVTYSTMETEDVVLPPQGGIFIAVPPRSIAVAEEGRKLMVIVKVKPLAKPKDDLSGVVRGFDAERNLAYVSFKGTVQVGQDVDIARGNEFVARGKVARITGEILLLKLPVGAKVRVGDTLAELH